jgi:modulator of FtsH protease HflC
MKTFITLCLVLVFAGFGATCFFFQVEESEFAVVTFFGNPRDEVEEPGLGFKWPWPVEDVIRIDRRVNITSPEEAEYLTRDKKNVLVSFFVAWKVVKPLKFLVSVHDRVGAESRIQDIIRSEVGARLGHYELSDLLPLAEAAGGEAPETALPQIMEDITGRVHTLLDQEFGIDVVAVRMRRLNFPKQNKQSVFERMEAERDRIARKYRSEGEEQAERVKADADLQQAELINAAKQWARETEGKADAQAARIYAEAYGKDPEFYTFLRKLEAYEIFLNEKSTIVIPSDSPLLDVLKEEKN